MIDLTPYLSDLNGTGAGWEDSYWHNDACQSCAFEYSDTMRMKLWIDSPVASEREYNHGGQFILVWENDNKTIDAEVMMITDDWHAIVALVAETNRTIKHYQDNGMQWKRMDS